MRTVHAAAGIPVALLLLGACSGGSSGTSGDGSTLATPARSSAPVVADGSLAPAVPITTLPGGASDDGSANSAVDGPVQIDVMVGTDSGADRVEMVKVGADVTLNITNPDAADQYVQAELGIDQQVDAGVTATINVTPDTAGTFPITSKVTGDVLVIIEVQ